MRIERRPNLWQDRFRRYRVELDGRVVAELEPGRCADLEIEPGEHTLSISGGGKRTPVTTFAVRPGQTASFECGTGTRATFVTEGYGAWLRAAEPET